MRNWEQMKDFSYVGIKSTKAQSISEGLTRCKVQKLTRRNPIYDHLKLHTTLKKKKIDCQVCASSVGETGRKMSESRPGTVHLKEQMEVGSRCKTEMLKQKKSLEILSFSQETTKMNIDSHGQELVNKIINKTPREVASKEGKRLRQVIDKFGDSMRRSKSQFHSMEKGVSKAESYFLTAVDDIQLEINQDKGLSLKQMKTDYQRLKDEMNEQRLKMKRMKKKAKELKKPVLFPFSAKEMATIVSFSIAVAPSPVPVKQKRQCMTSLYEYKSSANYCNRMKTISGIINK